MNAQATTSHIILRHANGNPVSILTDSTFEEVTHECGACNLPILAIRADEFHTAWAGTVAQDAHNSHCVAGGDEVTDEQWAEVADLYGM